MVRFNIIDTGFLDIEPDGIGFKKDNQQFRFSDITLGRSVEFDLPATDRNKRLLGYGDDPAMDGSMLRTRHECQMVYDGGAVMGSLEVKSFKGDCFGCVFYFGPIGFPIDRSLKDVPIGDAHVEWSFKTPVYPANEIPSDAPAIALVQYERSSNVLPPLPAIELKRFVEMVCDAVGVSHDIQLSWRYWVVFNTLMGAGKESVTFFMPSVASASVSQTTLFDVVDIDLKSATAVIFGAFVGGVTTPSKGFKVLADTEVTFGAAMPDNVFVVRWSSSLGNYVAVNADEHTGRVLPLAGRTLTLNKGSIYFFATKHPLYGYPHYGYESSDIPCPYTYNVVAARSSNLAESEDWYLRDNMPDMTVFDLLRSAALLSGCELTIEDSGRVRIWQAIYGYPYFKTVDNVISVDEVSRNVAAWGEDTRRAVVHFDSDDAVTDHIESVYEIDNGNIEREEIHLVMFSEGESGDDGLLIHDVAGTYDNYTVRLGKPVVAFIDSSKPGLQRVPPPSLYGHSDVAANSTCVRLRVLAGEADFFALKPLTTFVWRGMAYVWTSAEWSDGVLSLTLQKVSQER